MVSMSGCCIKKCIRRSADFISKKALREWRCVRWAWEQSCQIPRDLTTFMGQLVLAHSWRGLPGGLSSGVPDPCTPLLNPSSYSCANLLDRRYAIPIPSASLLYDCISATTAPPIFIRIHCDCEMSGYNYKSDELNHLNIST